MDFLELLQSFGLDMSSVAHALGIDVATLNNMDKDVLLHLLTSQTHQWGVTSQTPDKSDTPVRAATVKHCHQRSRRVDLDLGQTAEPRTHSLRGGSKTAKVILALWARSTVERGEENFKRKSPKQSSYDEINPEVVFPSAKAKKGLANLGEKRVFVFLQFCRVPVNHVV